MKQLTIRGLGFDLHQAIKQEAGRRNMSVNRYVLSILKKAVGLEDEHPQMEYNDLDELAGSWTIAETQEFEQYMAEQRVIDEDIWV